MEQLDLRVYAIVDPENTGGHDLIDLARAVAAGGATLVQLRDKVSHTVGMIEKARALKAALTPFGVPLIVNDRVDVALEAGADGVHVGQEDMAAEEARPIVRPNPLFHRPVGPHAGAGVRTGCPGPTRDEVVLPGLRLGLQRSLFLFFLPQVISCEPSAAIFCRFFCS